MQVLIGELREPRHDPAADGGGPAREFDETVEEEAAALEHLEPIFQVRTPNDDPPVWLRFYGSKGEVYFQHTGQDVFYPAAMVTTVRKGRRWT
jgi:hypothetical protein